MNPKDPLIVGLDIGMGSDRAPLLDCKEEIVQTAGRPVRRVFKPNPGNR
jgi:ribulose kinase